MPELGSLSNHLHIIKLGTLRCLDPCKPPKMIINLPGVLQYSKHGIHFEQNKDFFVTK